MPVTKDGARVRRLLALALDKRGALEERRNAALAAVELMNKLNWLEVEKEEEAPPIITPQDAEDVIQTGIKLVGHLDRLFRRQGKRRRF